MENIYEKHSKREKEQIKNYIEKMDDKTVLTETEEIIYNHFKRKYPYFDWLLEKWMYQSLLDLYNEGSDFWCQNTQHHYNGDFYHEGFSMVNYGSHFIELFKEKFGFEGEIVICEEGYRGNISQIESDFVDDLYNYSKDVVFTVFEIRKKLGSSILSDLLDELYTKRLFVVPIVQLCSPLYYGKDDGWEGGNFSHPKLQKNWCYEYLHKVPLVDLPLTYNLKERIDNKTIYLDTKKVDFQNTTPVFQQITPS